MPQFELTGANGPNWHALDQFTKGYIEALFFTNEGPEDGQLGDDAGFYDIAPAALSLIMADCAKFQEAHSTTLERVTEAEGSYELIQAGRDFWFTRCGHGVGFWDRQELTEADQQELTKGAQGFGNIDPYLGDDGKVYLG